MAKVLNYLIGVIGLLYISGQVVYYGLVNFLKVQGYSQAESLADNHKIFFDWIIFMAFLLVIFGFCALVVNFIKFQTPRFYLRISFNIVAIFMPFMHIKNHITIFVEGVFIALFGTYWFVTKKKVKQ